MFFKVIFVYRDGNLGSPCACQWTAFPVILRRDCSYVLLDPWLVVGSNVGMELHVLSSADILVCFSVALIGVNSRCIWDQVVWHFLVWYTDLLIGFQIDISFLSSAIQIFKETLESAIHISITIKSVVDYRSEGGKLWVGMV